MGSGKLKKFIGDHKAQIQGVVNPLLKGAVSTIPGGSLLTGMIGTGAFNKKEGETTGEYKERVADAVTAGVASGAGVAVGTANNPKTAQSAMNFMTKFSNLPMWQKGLVIVLLPLGIYFIVKAVKNRKNNYKR